MGRTNPHKRFFSVLAATFLFACLFGAVFNYLVDPYRLFGTNTSPRWNERKPAASERVRVIKPYMVARIRPAVVIGGNSRPEIGLDPQSACWGEAERPVFNMGIPGADVLMQTRYVEHAVELGNARRVVFGVDFLDFLVNASKPTGEIDWRALGKAYEGRLAQGTGTGILSAVNLQRADDLLSGLVSLAALSDSVSTIAAQRDRYAATRRADGFNPALDYVPIIRNEGQAVLFRQKNLEVRHRLSYWNLGVVDVDGRRTKALEALRRFLGWANSRGVEVVLFINPYHSDYLVQIELAGRWALFEEWKRQLASVAAEYGVPLWDFNAFDPYSTESPPAPGDRDSQLRWFWEPAHYRQELGDLMLASMLGKPCGRASEQGPFGTRITQATLQAHLDGLRADMMRFVDQNPQVIERLSVR